MPESRCDTSDLPTSMCAHCQGHDGRAIPALDVAPAPRQPKPPRPTAPPPPARRQYAPLTRGTRYPALCVNERCRTRTLDDGTRAPNPRATDGRANLCPVCEDRARDDLTAIADTWPDLEAALGATDTRTGEPVTASPTPGLVLNEAVSAAMADVEETLAFYGRRVRDERGASWPLGDPTVPELARWLARTHLVWLAAHPDQGVSEALCDDAHRLRRATHRAAYTAPPSRIRLPFRCRDDVPLNPDDEQSPIRVCAALMSATLHHNADTLPDLVCEAGHRTPPSAWTRRGWQRGPLDEAAITSLVRAMTSRTVASSSTPALS